jgi:drug/metabolite transporter (DMT)-like permease
MWLARGRGGARGMGLALGTAVLIAGYTLIDGLGVRRSGAPAAYTLWLSALTAVPLLSWALLTEKTAFLRYASGRLHQGLIGGIGTLASYGLALWAMTRAPVAMVAALRETSILFALGISAVFLKERPGRPRVVMACAIAAGAILMRLA